ncbi:MAG: hypothetical protein VCD00_04575 [Candidatus Hydrogenedentota bacterium]
MNAIKVSPVTGEKNVWTSKKIYLLLTVSVFTIAIYGCDKNDSVTQDDNGGFMTEISSGELTDQVKVLYEKAKADGEQVSEDVVEWAKSDVKKIGSWSYKIVSISFDSEDAIVEELNKLGDDRWECYCVETVPEGKRFYLKKSVRSYLQMAGKVSAFIPVPGGQQ